MRLVLGRLMLLVFAISICASQGRAQFRPKQNNSLRDVQGVVQTDEGKSVPGAVVQLKNTKTLQIISFITKDQGDYYFHGLSPDIDFELKAEHEGKISATRTLSSFDSRKQAILNLKLDRDKK